MVVENMIKDMIHKVQEIGKILRQILFEYSDCKHVTYIYKCMELFLPRYKKLKTDVD